jgi:hypothetical protein
MNSETINNRLNTFIVNVLPLSVKARFKFIKENYGYNSYKLYQSYENTTVKLVRLFGDLNFLYQCKSNNLIPKFLQFKLANPELVYTRSYWKCQNILLKEEIHLKKNNIKYTSMIKENLYNQLVNMFPSVVMKKIDRIIDEIQFKEDQTKYRTHSRKFNNLIYFRNKQQQRRKNQRVLLNTSLMNQMINIDNDNEIESIDNNNEIEPKLVWNFSNRNLSEEELCVLEKGLSYNRPGAINRSEVVSNVEYLFHHSSAVKKELIDFKKWDENPDNTSNKEIRILEPRQLSLAADLKNATEIFFSQAEMSIKTRKNKNINENNDDHLLLNLSKDPSILITKPDKGRGVVILNRNDYIKKLEQILSDNTKFKLLDKDPTGSRENALTTLLRQMKDEEYLTQQEYWYIKPVGSIPARLYGLPKVHKDNVPLRPIVSCIQSYNYRLGKFLAGIIKPIRDSTYSLKNTNAFLQFLKENSHLSKSNKMISFDIESLFTNIPVDETIEIICNKLYYTNPKLRPFIPENYLRELLKFATKCTHFLFNKKYYDQSDGVSMGTSLAAIFAEIFMADFEEKHLPGLLNNNSKLLAWRRYVDDTFTIFKADANPDEIKELLNSFHPCIKFTVESEIKSTIAFLDVLVKRHDNGFDTTVYRKKTTTKLMLKWNSLIPTAYKKSSVTALVNRAIRICSKFDLLHNELLHIRKMANFNGYPSNFVEQIINKQLAKLYPSKQIENQIQQTLNENKNYKYIEIPYIGAPSYAYAKRLKSIIQKNDPTAQLRVIYQTTNQTRRYFPTKDNLNKNQKSGVIYQISCFNCKNTYIGKTIRQTYRRLNEHEKDVAKATICISKALSLTQPTKQKNKNIINGRIQKKHLTQQLRRSSRLINKQLKSQSEVKQNQNDISFYKPNSALGKHVYKTAHSIDFENVDILKQDQRNYPLLIKESIEIRSRKPALNGTDTSVPLYVFPEGYKRSNIRPQ